MENCRSRNESLDLQRSKQEFGREDATREFVFDLIMDKFAALASDLIKFEQRYIQCYRPHDVDEE